MNDTRKDKRAPVSLKVRFKSATVDEFAEQYARDISHGGLFIKSKQPMAVGTLLKFELQLKDESKLIQGVGRVVWKREASDASSDQDPAGMGIKFIKMDPESRTLVDKIVDQRGAEPGQYEAGGGEAQDGAGDVVASPAARPVRSAKATMLFFPTAGPSESELPAPEDRTQVRQASEFLAAALSEASADGLASKEAEEKAEEARKRTEEIAREREAAAQRAKEEAEAKERAEKEALERAEREKAEAEAARKAEEEAAKAKADAAETAAAASADAKPKADAAEAKKGDDARKAAAREEAAATTKPAQPKATQPKATQPKATEPKAAAPAPAPAEPSSNMLPAILAGVVVLLGVGYFAWNALGGGESTSTSSTPTEATAEATPTPEPEEPAEPAEPAVEGDEGDEGTTEGSENTTEVEASGGEEAAVPAAMISFRVETTPARAEITVNGQPAGAAPLQVEAPEGEVTIVARLAGYAEQSSTVTLAAGQRPVRLTLAALPYRVTITTTPPGATVRIGSAAGTSPTTLTIPRPTRDTRVTAALAGHTTNNATISLDAFQQTSEAMVAETTIALTAVQRPAPTPTAAPTTPRPTPTTAEPTTPAATTTHEPSTPAPSTPAATPEPSAPAPAATPEPSAPAPTPAPNAGSESMTSSPVRDEAPPENPF